MSDWNSKVTVQKGNVGESVVDNYLISQGFIPYRPGSGGAHPFDRLVASRDKKTIYIADTKSKPARKYYPDTGIDVRHYQEYKYVQDKYSIDVFLFFVDEDRGTIYGNTLSELDKPRHEYNWNKGCIINYPLVQGGIRYFPLSAMNQIGKIPDNEINALRNLSTRNQSYKDAIDF